MVATWLPIVLSKLDNIPHWYPIVKDMDVLICQVLKGLQLLHVNLWLARDVSFTDKGSLPQSVRW